MVLLPERRPYYGFINNQYDPDVASIAEIQTMILDDDETVIESYEKKFAELIGEGQAVSFATARMAFYALLRQLNIGEGDEVVLLGFTCSVMVTAIQRVGASPVFSDIDPATYGSSLEGIRSVLSPRSKLLVAQHTFGIPCRIRDIAKLAAENGIFLLEDCALSLGSRVGGQTLGNFGDASIFSTDHTKPLNTVSGGILYTRLPELHASIKKQRDDSGSVPISKRIAQFDQFCFENVYTDPGYFRYFSVLNKIRYRFFLGDDPFFSQDYCPSIGSDYPYPSKLPAFLARLGILALDSWQTISQQRKFLLDNMLSIFNKSRYSEALPCIYRDNSVDIIPSRLIWHHENAGLISSQFSKFIDISWTWFKSPVVAVKRPLLDYGYIGHTCRQSEEISRIVINLPCMMPVRFHADYLARLEDVFVKENGTKA